MRALTLFGVILARIARTRSLRATTVSFQSRRVDTLSHGFPLFIIIIIIIFATCSASLDG